jgi:ubiquitin carboxyl-terminal hydrolase 9/13
MEGQQPAPQARVSDETAKDGLSLIKSTPILAQNATPIMEDTEHMESLAHAVTAPDIAVAQAAPAAVEQVQTTPATPLQPTKSKKERKAEEKAAKVAKKAEEKEVEEKRRQASAKRVEMWKKQDDDLRRAIEESKASAVDEAEKRGEKPPPVKEGGLSRFRHSSMSLRSKPKLFGSKDKDSERERLASVLQDRKENDSTTNGSDGVSSESPGIARVMTEGAAKKSRFSLGRKRSQALS